MPWLAPIMAAGASIGGAAISASAQNDATNKAIALAQETISEFEKLGVPPKEAQRLTLERFKEQGLYTPQLEDAILLGPSRAESVQADADAIEAEKRALAKLSQIGDEGGLLLEDKANLEGLLRDARTQAKGRRGAIERSMQARGMGGSGMELAAQLDSAQGSAEQESQDSLSIAAMAEKRALDSLMGAGTLGSRMRSQSFNEGMARADAGDAVERFNASMLADTNRRNVASQNAAQNQNLAQRQKYADLNTEMGNKERAYEVDQANQNWERKFRVAQAKGNARSGQANTFIDQGNNAASLAAGLSSGLSKAALAYGERAAKDQAADDAYARDMEFFEKTGRVRRT